MAQALLALQVQETPAEEGLAVNQVKPHAWLLTTQVVLSFWAGWVPAALLVVAAAPGDAEMLMVTGMLVATVVVELSASSGPVIPAHSHPLTSAHHKEKSHVR